jgi:uncharacterized membrane protein YccC
MIRKLVKTAALAVVIGIVYAIVASDHVVLRAVVILATFAVSIILEVVPEGS